MADDRARLRPVAATLLTLVTGDRYEVGGEPADVERVILSAARGSLLEFAWLEDAATGRAIGVNPAHVVAMRAVVSDEG
jgi:hypothetical protein